MCVNPFQPHQQISSALTDLYSIHNVTNYQHIQTLILMSSQEVEPAPEMLHPLVCVAVEEALDIADKREEH